VRKRRRLPSQAAAICAGVKSLLPLCTQSMPRDGPAALVASTTRWRTPGRAANQRPMMVSVAP